MAGCFCWFMSTWGRLEGCARLQDVDGKLQAQLEAALEQCASEVGTFMAPVMAMTQAQVDRLGGDLERVQQLSARLEDLSLQAANIE